MLQIKSLKSFILGKFDRQILGKYTLVPTSTMARQGSTSASISSDNSVHSTDNADYVKEYNKETIIRIGSDSSLESDQLVKNPFWIQK